MNMTVSEKLSSRPTVADPGTWMRMGRRLVAGVIGAVVAWGTRPVEEVDSYSDPELEVPDPLAFDLLTAGLLTADLRPDAAGSDAAGSDGLAIAELVSAHGRP